MRKYLSIIKLPLILAIIVTFINMAYGHIYYRGIQSYDEFLKMSYDPAFLIGASFISLLVYILVCYAGLIAVRDNNYSISEAFMTGVLMSIILFLVSAIYTVVAYTQFDYYRYILAVEQNTQVAVIVAIIVGFIASLAIYGGLGALGGWIAKRYYSNQPKMPSSKKSKKSGKKKR